MYQIWKKKVIENVYFHSEFFKNHLAGQEVLIIIIRNAHTHRKCIECFNKVYYFIILSLFICIGHS